MDFFNTLKQNINELRRLKENQYNLITLLNLTNDENYKKTISGIPFSIKNYNKWFKIISELEENTDFNNKTIEEIDIKQLSKTELKNDKKPTKGLCDRFKQIKENNQFTDLEDLKKIVKNIENDYRTELKKKH